MSRRGWKLPTRADRMAELPEAGGLGRRGNPRRKAPRTPAIPRVSQRPQPRRKVRRRKKLAKKPNRVKRAPMQRRLMAPAAKRILPRMPTPQRKARTATEIGRASCRERVEDEGADG